MLLKYYASCSVANLLKHSLWKTGTRLCQYFFFKLMAPRCPRDIIYPGLMNSCKSSQMLFITRWARGLLSEWRVYSINKMLGGKRLEKKFSSPLPTHQERQVGSHQRQVASFPTFPLPTFLNGIALTQGRYQYMCNGTFEQHFVSYISLVWKFIPEF